MSARADAGHSQVSAEAVAQRVHGRGLDMRAATDVLQLLEDVPVALTAAVRENPLLACSVGVLLEEKLLHGRRNRNDPRAGEAGIRTSTSVCSSR